MRLTELESTKIVVPDFGKQRAAERFPRFNAGFPLFQVIRQAPRTRCPVHPPVEQCRRTRRHRTPTRLLCTQSEVPTHSRTHMHRCVGRAAQRLCGQYRGWSLGQLCELFQLFITFASLWMERILAAYSKNSQYSDLVSVQFCTLSCVAVPQHLLVTCSVFEETLNSVVIETCWIL